MSSKRRRHTAEDRARVLADVRELGVVGAAQAHGVPQSCVSRWNAKSAKRKALPASKWTASETARTTLARHPMVATVPPQSAKHVARAYTPSERARALERAGEVGVVAAARELGSPRCRWFAQDFPVNPSSIIIAEGDRRAIPFECLAQRLLAADSRNELGEDS